MEFFSNLWPWPWASPVHMQQIRQRNYWEAQYHRVRRGLEAHEILSVSLYDENRALNEQSAKLRDETLAAAEKSRRQQQLLLKARNEISRKDEQHRQDINTLYTRLNALQSGPASLTDDNVRNRMRRLFFDLDSWIKSNFRDTAKLACITGSAEFPRTSPQRRVWIQSQVANLVYHMIFSPYRLGIEDEPWGEFMVRIEAGVQQTSSETSFQNWKIATGTAIEYMTTRERNGTLAYIIDRVETRFCTTASSDSTSRKQRLRIFLEHCATLKNILVRQPGMFTFFESPAGAVFSEEAMTSFGGDGKAGNIVRVSLWPALIKQDGATSYVIIEPELVWTTN